MDASEIAIPPPRTHRQADGIDVSIVVGTLLHTIGERLKLAGPIVRRVLGAAWSLATVFVVPVLVLEATPVRTGVRRSARLFRSRWGETATSHAGVGVLALLVGLAFCPLVGVVALVSVPVAICTGIVALAAAMAVVAALDGVLTAALYRYAADGRTGGPFSEDDLLARFAEG